MTGGRIRFIIQGALALGVLWALVWGMMSFAGVFEVTPEKVRDFVEKKPFSEISDPAERRRRLEKLADLVNHLDFAQRREFRGQENWEGREKNRRDFFEDLNREERLYFVDLTMGTAFKQMMIAFNEMDREERRRFVERARRDMEDNEGDRQRMSRLEEEDEQVYNKIVEEGLRAYYQEASAETKMDLAPLMEEMQRRMRMPGRHR